LHGIQAKYRLSTADEVIAFVVFPAGMLVAPHGSSENVCNPATLRPVLRKLRNLMRLKTRIVLLDCLLVLGIIVHWRLVGLWIDCLRERHGPTRRWIILAAAIEISGIVGEAAAFENWRPLELGAAILALIAFLAWVVLLLMFAVTAVRRAIRSGQKARASGRS
jgi:hypothetical protein